MRILVTGADQPLGERVAGALHHQHRLRLCGRGSGPAQPVAEYRQADLRSADQVAQVLAGMEAVLHFSSFDPPPAVDPQEEMDLLEHASLGTYHLFEAVRKLNLNRVVLASTLAFFDAYPEHYRIDELWRPRPSTQAHELAPWLTELVAREFAREGGIYAVGLRLAPLGNDPRRNTTPAEALLAIDRALVLKFTVPGYRWHVYHIGPPDRFIRREAHLRLGFPAAEGL